MRNQLIKQFDADRIALNERLSNLKNVTVELEAFGLCGKPHGFSCGEDIRGVTPATFKIMSEFVVAMWDANDRRQAQKVAA